MLRDIYPLLLRHHHLLPDAVGKQNPWVLFRLLDGLDSDGEDEINKNEHLRMFYGEEV